MFVLDIFIWLWHNVLNACQDSLSFVSFLLRSISVSIFIIKMMITDSAKEHFVLDVKALLYVSTTFEWNVRLFQPNAVNRRW